MYKFALLLTLAFIGASGKNLVRNDGNGNYMAEPLLKFPKFYKWFDSYDGF